MLTMAIMNELKILTVHQMVIKESIQFIHKVIFNQTPRVIFDLFTYSNCNNQNIRGVRKYIMKNSHKSQKVTNSLFLDHYIYIIDWKMKLECTILRKF